MSVRPPVLPRPDWGIADQRFAARQRKVTRWALRAEVIIMGTFALVTLLATPVVIGHIQSAIRLIRMGLIP